MTIRRVQNQINLSIRIRNKVSRSAGSLLKKIIFPFILLTVLLNLGSCSLNSSALNYCGLESALPKTTSIDRDERLSDSPRTKIEDTDYGNKYSETRYLMGTFLSMELFSPDLEKRALHQLSEDLFAVVAKIESEISHYREDSDIGLLNVLEANKGIELSPYSCLFIRESLYIANLTGGLIDVTVASGEAGRGFQNLKLVDCMLWKLHANTTIDPSGLGKGFALDILESLFRRSVADECVYLFLNFGTSSIGYLASDSCPSRVRELRAREVEMPQEGVIEDFAQIIGTSGEMSESNGEKFSSSTIELPTNHYLTTSYSGNIVNPLAENLTGGSSSGRFRENRVVQDSGVAIGKQGYQESIITKNAIIGEAEVKLKILNRKG